MSTYTKFAIVGAGGVGCGVTDELLKTGATVTILTRDDTKAELQPFKERGATLAKVDYDDEKSLEAALISSEVAVCAIHSYHIASQLPVARAAKAAGVQLFVPTEYGIPVVDGPNIMKQKVRDQLRELDLPYALFHTGLWAEFLSFFLGYNFKEGSMTVVGDGETKFSIVARGDMCRFIGHVLVTAPKSALEWATVAFEGDRRSPKEIAKLAEKKLGKKMELNLVDFKRTRKTTTRTSWRT